MLEKFLLKSYSLHQKQHFVFKVLEKVVLSKKIPWNMIFPDGISFTQKFCFSFWMEMKDDLFKKMHWWKYDIFSIIGKDDISFPCKYDITFWSKKLHWKLHLLLFGLYSYIESGTRNYDWNSTKIIYQPRQK